jgi:hypothetical protein
MLIWGGGELCGMGWEGAVVKIGKFVVVQPGDMELSLVLSLVPSGRIRNSSHVSSLFRFWSSTNRRVCFEDEEKSDEEAVFIHFPPARRHQRDSDRSRVSLSRTCSIIPHLISAATAAYFFVVVLLSFLLVIIKPTRHKGIQALLSASSH